MVRAKSRVVKEFEGGEDIRGLWWNLRKVKAKSRVVKEFEGGEGEI